MHPVFALYTLAVYLYFLMEEEAVVYMLMLIFNGRFLFFC